MELHIDIGQDTYTVCRDRKLRKKSVKPSSSLVLCLCISK